MEVGKPRGISWSPQSHWDKAVTLPLRVFWSSSKIITVVQRTCSFLTAAVCQVPQMRLKPQKFCLPQFRRPDLGSGVLVGWLLPEALRESAPHLFWLLVAPGVPRLVDIALQSLQLLPVCFPFSYRDACHWV